MQNWIITVIQKVLSDPEVQKWIKNLLSEIITEKIAPLVPLAGASAVKALVESNPGLAGAVDAVENVVQVAENTRQEMNRIIPDIDLGIPLIDSLMDVWRPQV